MRNGKSKKGTPDWLADWLAARPPLKSVYSKFGTLTTSPDPEELLKSIDDWLHAHPELAKIPRIAKAYNEIRQAALKEIEARQS